MTIKLSEEQKRKLTNSNDVYSIMQEILLREEKIDQEKEHFWMIGLTVTNRLLYLELVSMGSVRATTVEPMNVFRIAVLKGAVNVIMVHNHPSGEVMPSEPDKDLTDRLIQVGRILNINVIDHLIISLKSYYSFANIGLIEELQKSTKWVPQFELIARIRKEEQQLREQAIKAAEKKGIAIGVEKGIEKGVKKGEERGIKKGKKEGMEEGVKKGKIEGKIEGKKEEKFEIAKAGLKKGLSIEMISELTGLTGKEIKELMAGK